MKIAFIGAGQVSTALGLYFKNNGFEIGGYYSRSCKSTERAARLTHSHPYASAGELINDNQMIWITTPDDQIEAVVRQITLLPPPRKDEKLVLHASGAYPLSILNPLKENGYQTACAHPLLAFGDPVVAQEKLGNVWFAIEKPGEDNGQLTGFFKACGNQTFTVDPGKKSLYHAAACVLSNYLVTLLDASFAIFEKSGMPRDNIQEAARPLLESVILNLKGKDLKDALTGPIKRGDKNTVRMHLESLNALMPEMTALYTLMGRKTMQLLGDYSLEEVLNTPLSKQ
ncbi:MAG TPA: hypothetical protein DEP71_03125 [Porphyromonadaceae bacterium]|jgi:predicted short-subunit dehydrogenase-like oxidoreductase (DUF2520 family)|nr:Rossmann-like and DUF2520 domain-containing protein [Petrimonas sp.]NLU30014.1 DUF2520 domain-containing protein [Bacteroidales bacterium]BBD46724.1 Hypothetical protein PEIBARAKI_6717 [Petrimonas sp. IBARAKI]HBC37770.1 hypothetical protein [Porphyromonadaceae bacterium]HBF96231.1 hypothetical protein [Porphyromonadaceae bacterium]